MNNYSAEKDVMAPEIKLIALDLDGTTLDDKGKLTEETKNALASAVRKGVHVVIDTGRPFCALPEEIFGVEGIEYVITGNGSRTVRLEDNTAILSSVHSEEAVDRIIELLEGTSVIIEVMSEGNAFMERSVWENLENLGLTETRTEYLKRTRKPVDDIIGYLKKHKNSIEDVILDFAEPVSRGEYWEKLKESELMYVTASSPLNIELVGLTTSKAGGVIALGKLLGVEPCNMMACGDSLNDLAMLEACGFGVAMGNSSQEILEAADFVSLSNAENGVAYAIRKFVL